MLYAYFARKNDSCKALYASKKIDFI